MLKKIAIFLLFLFACATVYFPTAVSAETSPKTGLTKPTLQIDVPNFPGFSNDKGLWIGEYIKAIFNYGMSIVAILAAVILMWGGVLWLTAGGNQGQVGEAKAWIAASLTGLVIAMSSYTILYIINPNLVTFKSLSEYVTDIKKVEIEKKTKTGTTYIAPSGNVVGDGGWQYSDRPGLRPRYGEGLSPPIAYNKFYANLKIKRTTLDNITVNVSKRTATFKDNNGNTVVLPINIGQSGYSNQEEGIMGDQKTPLGSFRITETNKKNSEQYETFGPVFVNTDATDSQGNNRAIGFHGGIFNNGQLKPTNGCIRMDNVQIQQLYPYMRPGTVVNIIK